MNNFHSKKRKRHGFTFVELLVAITLVGVTLALVAQMMSISLQQNLTGQRRLANVEIANSVFEIISALPYGKTFSQDASGPLCCGSRRPRAGGGSGCFSR